MEDSLLIRGFDLFYSGVIYVYMIKLRIADVKRMLRGTPSPDLRISCRDGSTSFALNFRDKNGFHHQHTSR